MKITVLKESVSDHSEQDIVYILQPIAKEIEDLSVFLEDYYYAVLDILTMATKSDWSKVFDAVFRINEFCKMSGSLYDSFSEQDIEDLIDDLETVYYEMSLDKFDTLEKQIKRAGFSDYMEEGASGFLDYFYEINDQELKRVISQLKNL